MEISGFLRDKILESSKSKESQQHIKRMLAGFKMSSDWHKLPEPDEDLLDDLVATAATKRKEERETRNKKQKKSKRNHNKEKESSDSDDEEPGPISGSKDTYEVEEIVGHVSKLVGDKLKVFFIIKWKGYPDSENTKEPFSNMIDCEELVSEYLGSLTQTIIQDAEGPIIDES